jgi:hypothetical protein
VVTHDERMIAGFDRVYHMTDGRVTGERSRSSAARSPSVAPALMP